MWWRTNVSSLEVCLKYNSNVISVLWHLEVPLCRRCVWKSQMTTFLSSLFTVSEMGKKKLLKTFLSHNVPTKLVWEFPCSLKNSRFYMYLKGATPRLCNFNKPPHTAKKKLPTKSHPSKLLSLYILFDNTAQACGDPETMFPTPHFYGQCTCFWSAMPRVSTMLPVYTVALVTLPWPPMGCCRPDVSRPRFRGLGLTFAMSSRLLCSGQQGLPTRYAMRTTMPILVPMSIDWLLPKFLSFERSISGAGRASSMHHQRLACRGRRRPMPRPQKLWRRGRIASWISIFGPSSRTRLSCTRKWHALSWSATASCSAYWLRHSPASLVGARPRAQVLQNFLPTEYRGATQGTWTLKWPDLPSRSLCLQHQDPGRLFTAASPRSIAPNISYVCVRRVAESAVLLTITDKERWKASLVPLVASAKRTSAANSTKSPGKCHCPVANDRILSLSFPQKCLSTSRTYMMRKQLFTDLFWIQCGTNLFNRCLKCTYLSSFVVCLLSQWTCWLTFSCPDFLHDASPDFLRADTTMVDETLCVPRRVKCRHTLCIS